MTITEHISACEAKYEAIKAEYPEVSHINFNVTGIKYKELAAYATEIRRDISDNGECGRLIAHSDNLDITVWLYSAPVRIVRTVEIIEM